jgi:3-hydroxyacyl-CoA dehydrogenase/3-hydroxy-2-methylbutyryl-CoA dehydrogenase
MTLPLARDLAKHHVRVVNISPAPFLTPMLGNQPEPVIRTLKEKVFLYPNRFGRPEEFAKTVRWILDCAYVNGETIRLTGGGRVPGFLG